MYILTKFPKLNQNKMQSLGLKSLLFHGLLLLPGHRVIQLIIVVSVISSTQALLGSEADSSRFNRQILLQNQPISKLDSRLQTLLELKNSISDLVQPKDDATSGPYYDNNDIVMEKRVFCNGFTGCGGKLRGILGQQLALEDMRKRMQKAKRPFCNQTNGCKTKRKQNRNDLSRDAIGFGDFVNDDGYNGNSGADFISSQDKSRDKRLFCNHYGGCRNMGKRDGFLLPVLLGDTSSYEYPLDEQKQQTDVLVEPNKDKRFFNGGFDNKMDSLIANL